MKRITKTVTCNVPIVILKAYQHTVRKKTHNFFYIFFTIYTKSICDIKSYYNPSNSIHVAPANAPDMNIIARLMAFLIRRIPLSLDFSLSSHVSPYAIHGMLKFDLRQFFCLYQEIFRVSYQYNRLILVWNALHP